MKFDATGFTTHFTMYQQKKFLN